MKRFFVILFVILITIGLYFKFLHIEVYDNEIVEEGEYLTSIEWKADYWGDSGFFYFFPVENTLIIHRYDRGVLSVKKKTVDNYNIIRNSNGDIIKISFGIYVFRVGKNFAQ